MPRRRTPKPPTARCEQCKAHLRFFKSARSGLFTPFNYYAVDGRTHVGGRAYPIDNNQYWPLEELILELMARFGHSHDEAADLAYTRPWFVVHSCLPTEHPSPSPEPHL